LNFLKKGGKLFVATLFGFTVYLFFSLMIIVFLTKKTKDIEVPEVVGKKFTFVYNNLSKQKLKPDLVFKDVFDLEDGLILDQYPESGEIVSADSTIKLTLSRNNSKVEVPNLINKKLPFAKSRLKNLHQDEKSYSISTGVVSFLPSDQYGENVIMAQSPKAGQRILPNQKVNLLVSSGKSSSTSEIPNLINQSIDLCFDLLLAKGAKIKEELIITDQLEKSGLIVKQIPKANFSLPKNKIIYLKILYYSLRDHPYKAYEKVSYHLTESDRKGLYKAYIEDDQTKRVRFFDFKKPGEKIEFVFHRTGNAKVTILHNNKKVKVIKINVS